MPFGVLAVPVTQTTGRVPDPRRTTAPEAHVKLVAVRGVALTPVARHVDRLVPVAAAEAHVRLVSAIEDVAGARSRHPSAYTSMRRRGTLLRTPLDDRFHRDLRPMPSAEPLPKPPVIVRRSRPDAPMAPNRPGAAVNAARTSAQKRTSNGARPDTATERPDPPTTGVTPLCHEFSHDDAGYLAWVDAHPHGFVLNQPQAAAFKDSNHAPRRMRLGGGAP